MPHGEDLAQPVGELEPARERRVGEVDRELLAGVGSREVAALEMFVRQLGHELEYEIAHPVPVAVVEGLELVDVGRHQGDRTTVLRHPRRQFREYRAEPLAVGEAGRRIDRSRFSRGPEGSAQLADLGRGRGEPALEPRGERSHPLGLLGDPGERFADPCGVERLRHRAPHRGERAAEATGFLAGFGRLALRSTDQSVEPAAVLQEGARRRALEEPVVQHPQPDRLRAGSFPLELGESSARAGMLAGQVGESHPVVLGSGWDRPRLEPGEGREGGRSGVVRQARLPTCASGRVAGVSGL